MRCDNCGLDIPRGSTFCVHCGVDVPAGEREADSADCTVRGPALDLAPFTPRRIRASFEDDAPASASQPGKACSNCGRPVALDANFCSNCGEKTEGRNARKPNRTLCAVCGESFAPDAVKTVQGQPMCAGCRALREASNKTGRIRKAEAAPVEAKVAARPARNDPRLDVEGFYIRLATRRKQGLLRVFGGADQSAVSPIIDLSLGGMQCVTDLPLDRGERVRVEMFLPDQSSTLILDGDVRWLAKPDTDGTRRVGIQFVASDFAFRGMLMPFLQNLSMKEFRALYRNHGSNNDA